MTAREHDPALVKKVQDMFATQMGKNHALAVLDAVADDIARAAVADYIRTGGAGGVDIITQCVTAERERIAAMLRKVTDRAEGPTAAKFADVRAILADLEG